MSARVTLYGKPGCHLCDDARVIIEAVCAEAGAEWTEVDITQDDALFTQYGEQHDFWRVSADRLRAALAR